MQEIFNSCDSGISGKIARYFTALEVVSRKEQVLSTFVKPMDCSGPLSQSFSAHEFYPKMYSQFVVFNNVLLLFKRSELKTDCALTGLNYDRSSFRPISALILQIELTEIAAGPATNTFFAYHSINSDIDALVIPAVEQIV